MRGEQCFSPGRLAAGIGSPPLARGTVLSGTPKQVAWAITPACAGNSALCFIFPPARRDHPRLRGEQQPEPQNGLFPAGSPPLARGTATIFAVDNNAFRITPACAGNSCAAPIFRGRRGDHPRLRGEQKEMLNLRTHTRGSPPLARGTAHSGALSRGTRRITPACAGNRDTQTS